MIKDLVFVIFGTVLGLIFSGKKEGVEISNTTSIKQIVYIIQQKIININYYTKERETDKKQQIDKRNVSDSLSTSKTSKQKSESDNSNESIAFVMVITLGVAILYSKNHQLLLNIFFSITLLVLSSIITLTIKLYRDNQYDRLNQWWTIFIFILIVFNFITISFMSQQDIEVIGGIEKILRITYYAIGFFIAILINVILSILMVHLFAMNYY